MARRVVIIGGGIIGLSTAWFCRQRGWEVTLVDRHPSRRDGCSFGNAGMIVPSHFVPLAAPGMVALGLRMMWNPRSPFSFRPRLSPPLWKWAWQFQKACNRKHVQRSAPLLRDLSHRSRQLYVALDEQFSGAFGLQQRGLLMLCRTPAGFHEEQQTAKLAVEHGIDAHPLDADATRQLQPEIELEVAGSVYYAGDCHLDPNLLMAELEKRLAATGCEFLWEHEAAGFRSDHAARRILAVQATPVGELEPSSNAATQPSQKAKGQPQEVEADEFVVCGGAWSNDLGRSLELNLPMQAGKGYSLTLTQPAQLPKICAILTEDRVAVTPMGRQLRFGGTMEITGLDESISQRRIEGIIESSCRVFTAFQPADFTAVEPCRAALSRPACSRECRPSPADAVLLFWQPRAP